MYMFSYAIMHSSVFTNNYPCEPVILGTYNVLRCRDILKNAVKFF